MTDIVTVSADSFGPPPMIRREARTPEGNDGDRVAWAWKHWDSQTNALRLRDRQVEENVRMICGQQYIVWNTLLQKFVDVSHWFSDEERRWRQRPVFNRILPWFMTTHARMVENPPILTFLPGPDQMDAELAEVMDNVFKAVWRDIGMTDVNDRLMTWVIAGGRGYLVTRVDLNKGPLKAWVGEATLPLLDLATMQPILDPHGQPILQTVPDVPFDAQGNPLGFLSPDGLQATGQPHFEREGSIVVDVLSPLEVRSQWGPQPFHMKQWHAQKSYLTTEEVYDTYGVHVAPNVDGISVDGAGELERLMFGTGYFGAASQKVGSETSAPRATSDKYVEILTFWHAPTNCELKGERRVPDPKTGEMPPGGMAETPTSPGGRMLVTTRLKVLHDSTRPLRYPYCSPIRCFDFARVPGRPQGTTPQEMMNGAQRAYNRGWAAILEHRNLMTNPIRLVDAGSGLGAVEITNEPGQGYEVVRRQGVPAMEFVTPPALGADVYKAQQMLLQELTDMGNLNGTDGETPTRDASGELVKELRFNSDRYLGPTMRRAVEEYGRLAEDWLVTIPVLWDREKVITYAGDDNVARTITVYPQMLLGGKVNVIPDVESMLPEGRGERQAKVYRMYQDGLFGLPGQPDAVKTYLSLANFPNLSRAARPGGPHRVTAEQLLGRIVLGEPAMNIPWEPWYDAATHMDVFVTFMAGPEFLRLDAPIQMQLAARWQFLMLQMSAQHPPTPPMPTGPFTEPGAAKGGVGTPGAPEDIQPPLGQGPPGQSQPAMPHGMAPNFASQSPISSPGADSGMFQQPPASSPQFANQPSMSGAR